MYNEERKREFINEFYANEDSIDVYVSMFNNAALFENKLNKDLSEFTTDEIEAMYTDIQSASVKYLSSLNSLFSKYVGWLGVQNNYIRYSFSDMGLFVKKEVYTEIDLIILSRKFDNMVDKFLLLAPYYGFTSKDEFKDIELLTQDNIMLSEGEIKLWNRTITAPNWFIKIILETFNTYTYVARKDQEHGEIIYDLMGDGLIKFFRSANYAGGGIRDYIYNKYKRLFKKVDPNISYINVFKSGVIDRTKRIMLEKGYTDIKEVWGDDDFLIDVVERYQLTKKKFYDGFKYII